MSSISLPRINEEIVKELQFIDQVAIGDWYCYHNYTEMRDFGYELSPYELPKYLPVRIFALEYLRKDGMKMKYILWLPKINHNLSSKLKFVPSFIIPGMQGRK